MSVEGLEPPTNGLKGHCSTIELHARLRVGFYHAGGGKSTGMGGAYPTRDRGQETEDRADETGLGYSIIHQICLLITDYSLLLFSS